MDFLSNYFNEFESDRREKQKIIKDLKEEVAYQNGKVDDITVETDMQELYLLIHGIPVNNDENTDALALQLFETKMQVNITSKN